MDYLSSSIFLDDPLFSQNDHHDDHVIFQNITGFMLPTQLEVKNGDQIIQSTLEQNNHQIPTFDLCPQKYNNNNIAQREKRPLSSTVDHEHDHDHQENDKKKKQKIIHREVERQRRHEMSFLHTSLKSLLPLQYTKGKRSISDHLDVAVKYIKHMQQKIQALSDRRDCLRKEVSLNNPYEYEHDVVVNVFKGSLDVIVSTTYPNDDDYQGLPLSKVLRCLVDQGVDVVSSISKKVNTRFVHSIHAQVGDKDISAIDATNLKKKLAAINKSE